MKTTVIPVIVKPSRGSIGDGLFAGTSIAKGEFIIEYTGKKISTTLADTMKTRYLFEIDKQWTVDAEEQFNTARYINHSCDPNAEADIKGGRILISAMKNIPAGEEITIDYGDEYFKEFIKPVGCKCGARKHRG